MFKVKIKKKCPAIGVLQYIEKNSFKQIKIVTHFAIHDTNMRIPTL